jgi:hypothetical protein
LNLKLPGRLNSKPKAPGLFFFPNRDPRGVRAGAGSAGGACQTAHSFEPPSHWPGQAAGPGRVATTEAGSLADYDPEPSGAYRPRVGGFTLGWDSGRPGSGLKQPRAPRPATRAWEPRRDRTARARQPPAAPTACLARTRSTPRDIRLIAQEPSTISGRIWQTRVREDFGNSEDMPPTGSCHRQLAVPRSTSCRL